MRRRSRAGGEASKARSRKALKTKCRDASTSPTASIHQADVVRIGRPLSEAREQLKATSEVLRIISSSGGEPRPVFQAILENATRLCEAKFGALWRVDGETFHAASTQSLPPAMAKYLRRGPVRPGRAS